MKFYNPWKPHIVEDGFGVFSIRVLKFIGWYSYNEQDNEFYCLMPPTSYFSVERARAALPRAVLLHCGEKQGYKVVQ